MHSKVHVSTGVGLLMTLRVHAGKLNDVKTIIGLRSEICCFVELKVTPSVPDPVHVEMGWKPQALPFFLCF